ncbi:MAG: leucyl aminopeptidase [Actinomycetales bacterium]|nr:leucyl aminopeptidase [Actinomycetales bacterium]
MTVSATCASHESIVIVGATTSAANGVGLYARGEYAALAELLPSFDVSGSVDSVSRVVDPNDPKKSIVVVGLGSEPVDVNALRGAAGAAIRRLAGTNKVTFAFPVDSDEQILAVLEGSALGAYSFTSYKSVQPTKLPVQHIEVWTDTAMAESLIGEALIRADAVALVKDLVNTPPNDLYPETFTEQALASLSGLPVTHEIWDEKKLKRDGFGGILGVGKGSSRPPRLMKIVYSPSGATKHVSLVGKGITFDTGGLSLKPPTSMIGMKYDMTGAATTLAVIRAIASSGLNLKVTAWLCLAENMPSSTATRPNDVLVIRGGKTVEVLNTDAEGRLVLADGLVAASEEHPDLIIDVATLTGAATVALGTRYAGAMGSADMISHLVEDGTKNGENFWHMPLPSELRPLLNSDIADIANIKPGNTAAGMLIAAAFLREFIGATSDEANATSIPWIHLDIAGTANNAGSPYGFTGVGPTGISVRTLIAFAERLATA